MRIIAELNYLVEVFCILIFLNPKEGFLVQL